MFRSTRPTTIIVASPDVPAPVLVALVVLGNAHSCLYQCCFGPSLSDLCTRHRTPLTTNVDFSESGTSTWYSTGSSSAKATIC